MNYPTSSDRLMSRALWFVAAAGIAAAIMIASAQHGSTQGATKAGPKIIDTSVGVLLFDESNGRTFKFREPTPGAPVWQEVTIAQAPGTWPYIDRLEYDVVSKGASVQDEAARGVMLLSDFDEGLYSSGNQPRSGPKTLLAGDLIVAVNGAVVTDLRTFVLAIADVRSSVANHEAETFTVRVSRSGDQHTFTMRAAARLPAPRDAR